MRAVLLIVLAAWLSLAGVVFAQGDSDSQSPDESNHEQSAPTAEDQAPAGPTLQPVDNAPVVCDPAYPGFRYLEVRGTGFDAWATQRLVGSFVDSTGVPQAQWSSVWVSPQGRLTLEVNLCNDPFRSRPAFPAGDYTVAVGAASGAPIAAAGVSLVPPGESAPDQGDQVAPAVGSNATPTATPYTFVVPNVQAQPTPTPLPAVSLPGASLPGLTATPAAQARSGPGSSAQQPFPLGAPGLLADGWQLVVTGVTPDAFTGIKAAVPSATAPASDQRDFQVRVEATYLGQGTGVFSATRLALATGSQTVYDQLNNNCGVIADAFPPNLMTSGGVVRGNVCFTVRASDIDSLVLFDNQTGPQDHVYFALK